MTLLDMENKEGILLALKSLEKDGSSVPAILEEYLREVARHGQTLIPWVHVKPLILHKFNQIVSEFVEEFSQEDYFRGRVLSQTSLCELRQRVFDTLKSFQGTPFTIQRICELLIQPRKHYTRPDKFLRGFERTCSVVSTVDCYGNKIHNLDPRFSGDSDPDDSSILNGSFTDVGSTGSAEDTSLTKRSDEDEEDDDGFPKPPKSRRLESSSTTISESTSAWSTTVTPPRPRISFHRPFSSSAQGNNFERSSPSKSPTEDEKTTKISPDLSTTVDSPPSYVQVPGKQSLQRPFLSALNSATASDVFRSLESTTTGGIGEHRAFDASPEKAEVMSIRRLFSGTESEGAELSKLSDPVPSTTANAPVGVPHIDQMLRPMGQLEAFVNTISMNASMESSSTENLAVPIEGSAFCQSEFSSTSTTGSDLPSEPLATVPTTSAEEARRVQPSSEEIVESKENELVAPGDPVDESYTQAEESKATEVDKDPSQVPAAAVSEPVELDSPVIDTDGSCRGILPPDLEACASSAKRPRLKSPPSDDFAIPTAEPQEPVNVDLNRVSLNRMDQESGEWVPAVDHAITETASPGEAKLPALENITASEQQLEDEGSSAQTVEEHQTQRDVEVPAATAAAVAAAEDVPNAHIDSETGEQESS
nr:unnamed protein product [Spirometra erinaceieuropaei]